MAENKKYYFLKLKEDFFDQREIVVLEGSKDGILYVNILLKMYLKSLQHNGKLLLNEQTPLSAEMIALLTRHEVGTVERAMRAFMQLGLVVVQENDIYYMPEIEQMTGKGSSDAERKARYRRQKVEENTLLLEDKNTGMGQNWDNVPPVSQIFPPEIRDKRLDIRDKSIENRECDNDAHAYGKYGNVFLAEREMSELQNEFSDSVLQDYVERLSEYMESTGREYKSHAATIRRWANADRKGAAPPARNRDYTVKEGDTI